MYPEIVADPIKISRELLQDSAFDMNSFIAQAIGERIGRFNAGLLINGTGTNEPQGLVNVTQGTTTASATSITFDNILDFIHSIDPVYRNRSTVRFVMHDDTLLRLRKAKDMNGQYIWQPGTLVGEPGRIFGYPYVIDNNVAKMDAGAGSAVMFFGDLSKFKVREVAAVYLQRLVELYALQGCIGFIADMRWDSKILDAGTHPIKKMVVAGSGG